MKNVYDIRYEKNLTYILPEKAYAETEPLTSEIYERTAVIIYLYYIDTLSVYYDYIDNIPIDIDIYILSSRQDVLTEISEHLNVLGRRNVQYFLKENRGRDVSALLVTGRDIVRRYQYICFLHDKKEHTAEEKHDIDLWIENLWGNQIGSSSYIDEILRLFESRNDLGILAPPEPIGDHCTTWFGYGWYGSYNITKKISDQLELNADIREDKPPITFGTVLWFRTIALQKLFEAEWRYSDFNDEYLGRDDYLSYGLERIFAYVAQDAGYETGIAMTISYAEKQTSYLQYATSTIMHEKDKFFPISEMSKINCYKRNYVKLVEFGKRNKSLYLYGAGRMGRFCFSLLRLEHVLPAGYIVSENKESAILDDIPVFLIDELERIQDIAVVITVDRLDIQEEIVAQLKKRRINNYIRFWNREEKW